MMRPPRPDVGFAFNQANRRPAQARVRTGGFLRWLSGFDRPPVAAGRQARCGAPRRMGPRTGAEWRAATLVRPRSRALRRVSPSLHRRTRRAGGEAARTAPAGACRPVDACLRSARRGAQRRSCVGADPAQRPTLKMTPAAAVNRDPCVRESRVDASLDAGKVPYDGLHVAPGGTTSTGHRATPINVVETLPRNAALNAPRPREPTTII